MADETEETCLVDGLRGVDGDVGAEGSAEREDGHPANGEACHEQDQADFSDPVGSAKHGWRVRLAYRNTDCERDEDDYPKNEQGASVTDVSGAAPGARGDEDDYLRNDPDPVEYGRKHRHGHAARETKKHEGESLWGRFRPKLAVFFCMDRRAILPYLPEEIEDRLGQHGAGWPAPL